MHQPILGCDIVQVAYHVADIEQSAKWAAKTLGAGPFVVSRDIELSESVHRGEPCPFVHSSAYGQWGKIMLELVQQESSGASPFRDLYSEDEQGLHHVAMMVDDMDAAVGHFEDAGVPRVTRAVTLSGVEFAFLDATATFGHYIEIYEAGAAVKGFYEHVEALSKKNWDVNDPFFPSTGKLVNG